MLTIVLYCIVLYCIVYLLSSDGHMDRVIFYNNEGIKLDHNQSYGTFVDAEGDELERKIVKVGRFF